jgi:hypothetical protein
MFFHFVKLSHHLLRQRFWLMLPQEEICDSTENVAVQRLKGDHINVGQRVAKEGAQKR